MDALAHYQIACEHDVNGREREAIPHYEAALANGLPLEDRRSALLGLGSSLRCLGEYEKSLAVFDRALGEFPADRSLRAFRALTLYNLGRPAEAIGELLTQLVDTTADPDIKTYSRALRFYADKLDKKWD